MKSYTEKDLEGELDKLIEKKIFDEKIKEIIDFDKLMSFYQSDLIRKLIDENVPKRSEESFLMAYDGYYVNGQIDLIFEDKDSVILIDFKTDMVKEKKPIRPSLPSIRKLSRKPWARK